MIKKFALFLYHVSGSVLLYGALLWTIWFCGKLLFFVSNNSWIVPTVITKEDPAVLDVAQKIITTTQALDALQLDARKNIEAIGEMQAHRQELSRLYPQLVTAIRTETSANSENGRRLSDLDAIAIGKDEQFAQAADKANDVAREIDRDLSAGLITKTDAAIKKEQFAEQSAAALDDQINEVLLNDQILQKAPAGTEALDVLDKRAELRSQIVTLELSLAAARRELDSDHAQIDQLNEALRLVNQTPYAAVLNGAQTFAFVPYTDGTIQPGTPVFRCYLEFFFCRQAGQIVAVFSDEQRVQNPVSIPMLSTTIRGVIAQIHLRDANAAKDAALFIRRPPLWF